MSANSLNKFEYKYNDLQRKWLDDLKTTQAKQVQEYLHIRDASTGFEGFCCLGRACVVAGLPELDYGCDNSIEYGQNGEENLPEDFYPKLKLLNRGGKLKRGIAIVSPEGFRQAIYKHLTCLNDEAEWTFKQIAEYIEANPDNVFSDYDEQKQAWERNNG